MISISLIGLATALLLCALLAKVIGKEPKANKSQKAEILARLLALSEEEKKASGTAAPVRLRAALPSKGSRVYSAAIHSDK